MTSFNPCDHFGFLTNRVARLITQNVEPFLVAEGYTFPASCIGVLADLWYKDGVNQKELGVSLIKTKSSINKMLVALEEHGLIVKKDDPMDGRGKLIYLTKEGKEFQYKLEAKASTMEAMLLSDCDDHEIKIAKKVLEKMYKKLHACQEPKINLQNNI